eukprot:621073_1
MASPKSVSKIFVYGCYGYSGTLIVKQALKIGLKLILGGRNPDKCISLAASVGLDPIKDVIAFGLDNADTVDHAFARIKEECSVVMNAAGPYKYTFPQVAKACLKHKLHYLDITGEWSVFRDARDLDLAAKDAGILILPGCGFDVVSTDCLAAYVLEKLPSADSFAIALKGGGGGVSRGTALSVVEILKGGNHHVENGGFVDSAYETRDIRFSSDRPPNKCVIFPGADLVSVTHTTGARSVKMFMAVGPVEDWTFWAGGFWPTRAIMAWIPKSVWLLIAPSTGPSEADRERFRMRAWVEAKCTASGERVQAQLECSEGYKFTSLVATEIMQRVLDPEFIERKHCGYQTPGKLFGAGLLKIDPNVSIVDVNMVDPE